MKTIIKFLVFLSFTFSFAQEHFKFYVEIPNSTLVPEVSYLRNGTVNLSFTNRELNSLFSNYSIHKFEKIFPTSETQRLQTLYLIESINSDLFNNLKTNYTNYFPTIKEQNAVGELLYTPNDWDLNDPVYHHANYDLMNVQEAWEYSKGDPDFLIGISDSGINLNHEDLISKVTALDIATDWHGTSVVGIAAANTDNNIGIPGIGFNSKALFKTYYGTPLQMMNTLLQLSQNGARVVNASWHNGTCSYNADEQLVMDEIHNNGTVIVAAAGNGNTCSNSSNYANTYVYPASYNHVISVSSVGMAEVGYQACCGDYVGLPFNWRDRIEFFPGHPELIRHQTNDKVDIRAPGIDVRSLFDPRHQNEGTNYAHIFGTSIAAPQVSGAVSLMFTANACLNPDEVESLIKLTSVKLDSIQQNLPYLGKLGAGRLDAGKATKAAWQMNPANGGEVLLTNRTFERWDFELLNSPEYIRLKNEEFIQNANVKFRAKKGITLDNNTLLAPGSGKSHYLYVENTDTCSYFNQTYNPRQIVGKKEKATLPKSSMKLYPNPSRDYINIQTESNIHRIYIYDMSGKIVETNYSADKINIENLPKGNYLIKIQLVNSETETIKFTKN